jgi:hypothetical protein
MYGWKCRMPCLTLLCRACTIFISESPVVDYVVSNVWYRHGGMYTVCVTSDNFQLKYISQHSIRCLIPLRSSDRFVRHALTVNSVNGHRTLYPFCLGSKKLC